MAQADADRNRMTQQNRQQHGVTAGNVPTSGSASSELRLRSEMKQAGKTSSGSTTNSKKPRFKPFGDPAKAKTYREEKQRKVLQDISNAKTEGDAALTCEGDACYEVVDIVNNQGVTTNLAPNGLSAEIDIEQQR